MNRWVAAALCVALTGLAACATGRGAAPSSAPPQASGGRAGSPPPAATPQRPAPPRATAQPAGSTCRFCVTGDPGRRQYFDQRRKRYYYFDRVRKAYFWENGEAKS